MDHKTIFTDMGCGVFRATVVPQKRRRVKVSIPDRRQVTCGECVNWCPDRLGWSGVTSDGVMHLYGICSITKDQCLDSHYCGYAERLTMQEDDK